MVLEGVFYYFADLYKKSISYGLIIMKLKCLACITKDFYMRSYKIKGIEV